MKKLLIILFILIALCIIYFFIDYLTLNSYEKIENYVIKNEDKLLNLVDKKLAHEETEEPLEIKNITIYDESMVEFSTISFINQYLGFYYSKNNLPLAFQNSNVQFKKESDTTWTWKDNGDNKGKTIKIKDNWYYYEANL